MLNSGISDENILVIQGPIDSEETLKKLVDRTVAKFGRLDILVRSLANLTEYCESLCIFVGISCEENERALVQINNAGVAGQSKTEADGDFDYLFNVNLKR